MSQAKLVVTSILSIFITSLLFAIVSFKSVPVRPNPEKLSKRIIMSDKKVNEIIAMDWREELYMSEKGEMMIQNDLIKPLQKLLKIKHSPKMFSRCPSGLGFIVLQNPESKTEYFQGLIENFEGCEGQEVCSFRMNAAESTLEVLDTPNERYIPAAQWLQVYAKNRHAQAQIK